MWRDGANTKLRLRNRNDECIMLQTKIPKQIKLISNLKV